MARPTRRSAALLALARLAPLLGGSGAPEACGAACDSAAGDLQGDDTVSMLQIRSPAAAAAVPSFDIDLDLPPERRWLEVTKRYRTELIAMSKTFMPAVDKQVGALKEEFVKHSGLDKYPGYMAELKGIVAAVDDPAVTVDELTLVNMIYELQSPTLSTACSGVLWSLPNGTVMHGRNMDYALKFLMPDGRTLNWPDVTFEATWRKGGKPLFKSTQWPGAVGIHTAMRFGGWTFEQNTRSARNEWHANLDAAKKGGAVNGWVARHVMETTPDFKTAVKLLFDARLMAPQYFVMSGAGPYEGAVLTVDRLGKHLPDTPIPLQYLSNSSSSWHLVQTNDDLGKLPEDPRRSTANAMLKSQPQGFVTKEHLMQFMHTPMLFNPGTVFSTVMIPATGFYKTMLPWDPPPALTDPLIRLAGGSGAAGWFAKSLQSSS